PPLGEAAGEPSLDLLLPCARHQLHDYTIAPSCQGPARLPCRAMRVIVDFDVCQSNALCMGEAPEVFEVRDDGFLYVLNENPPDGLREKVAEAARVCPTQAITIED